MRELRFITRFKNWFSQPRSLFLKFNFLFTNTDFVLRISRLHNRHKQHTKGTYFPPPGYGIPPGKQAPPSAYEPTHEYGLFLIAGRIRVWLLMYFLVAIFMLLPTYEHSAWAYGGYLLFFGMLSYVLYKIIYYLMPPVLNEVWKCWPLTAYRQFLSVPHLIELKGPDKDKVSEKETYQFWRPDKSAWISRQSTQYAPDSRSLQEVILDMAIFELFFNLNPSQKKTQTAARSLNAKHAFLFLLSPVWGNYLLLLISAMLFLIFHDSECGESRIMCYPYSFVPAILIWFGISALYISSLFKKLSNMGDKIASGYYQSHFDMVPPQILTALTDIPTSRQIRRAVSHLWGLLNIIGGLAVVIFLAMLEVIAGAYSGG